MTIQSFHPCSYNASHFLPSTTPTTFQYLNAFGFAAAFDRNFAYYSTPATASWPKNASDFPWSDYEYPDKSSNIDSNHMDKSNSQLSKKLTFLNKAAYLYITPIIIGFGIVGDILSIAVLSHPLLRKTSVVYSYLLALAVTDLLTLISVIPPIMWIMKFKLCTLSAARYYAHVGFPLANAFMGASVYIVVFLTFNQYMAVCHPFVRSDFIRSRKNCLILTLIAYLLSFALYVPWAWRKTVRYVGEFHDTFKLCPYEACDDLRVVESVWYKTYQWTREMISRFVPFLLIAYFNLRMLYVYRSTRARRMDVVGLREQKMTLRQKTEREQRRLWALLFGIMTLFFVCTIPAAPFTIMVSDRLESNLTFQTVRAITNVLEFTKFALNFYLYCMINPDIRRLCLKRLTCQTSINALRAPMVASKNSYHLSDLLQMSEKKHAQRQQKKSATATGTTGTVGSFDFGNSRKTRRSLRSRQDSEKPLLTSGANRRHDRCRAVLSDGTVRQHDSGTNALDEIRESVPKLEKQRNGSLVESVQKSEPDIILHDQPSISWMSYSKLFEEGISDDDLYWDSSNICDTYTKSTVNA